jgi:hypothetical protein
VVCGLKGKKRKREVGRLGRKRKGEREEGFRVFFFLVLFKFIFSNLQTSLKQETMHSNHDAQTLIILTLSK